MYHPTPLVKLIFLAANVLQLLEQHIFQKIAEVCTLPLQEMSRCRVAKLWRVAITGTTRSANKYQVFVTS